jgi:Right handed beta helix region
MKRRGAVLLFAVVAAVGLVAGPAGATGFGHGHARPLVVDDDLRGCHGWRATHRTIQSAIGDAGEGATIWVCPGRYNETVKVDKRGLTLLGANAGRDATAGDRRHESVVTNLVPDPDALGTVQLLEDDITWDGFTIQGVFGRPNAPGMYTSPAFSGYSVLNTVFEDNGTGLHLGSDGTNPTVVCRNLFVANNEFNGPAGAIGIYSNEGARQVLITGNRFERHNTSAILFADVDLDPATPEVLQQDVVIEGNISVDDLSFAVIYNSTRVRVTGNDVRARVGDEKFPGPASAIRIGARDHDVVVDRNRIRSASGNGIDVTDAGEKDREPAAPTKVEVLQNKVKHAELLGIDVSASAVHEYEVRGNRALANGQVGIHLGPLADDAQVTGNVALGNGGADGFDCQDESDGEGPADGTAGTENTWQDNVGVRADPAGICAAPTATDQPTGHGHGDGKDHGKRWGHKHHKQHKEHAEPAPDPCLCGTLPWWY